MPVRPTVPLFLFMGKIVVFCLPSFSVLFLFLPLVLLKYYQVSVNDVPESDVPVLLVSKNMTNSFNKYELNH